MNLPVLVGLVLYGAVLLVLDRKSRTAQLLDYLLAGRRLTLVPFVATLVATWYGGVLGVGEFSYRYGLANWMVFGVPYYLAALLFAFGLAARVRASAVLSIPEQLKASYGPTTARVGAVLVLLMATPAAYTLMLGQLLEVYLGVPRHLGVVGATAFTVFSVMFGGFRTVVRANLVQFVLMYAAFLLILPTALAQIGGWAALWNALPASHKTLTGGLPLQAIAVWYVIALQTLVEPSFYQRCYAASTPRVARVGVLLSVLFWVLFDFLTTFSGLAARVLVPNLADPGLAYPALGNLLLSPWLNAVFAVGLFATVSSTAHSYLFLAASTAGHDLLPPQARGWERLWVGVCLVMVGAIASLLALSLGSVVLIWHHLGSIVTSALLVPLVLAHGPARRRYSPRGALVAVLGSAAGAAWWILQGGEGGYPLNLEPIFPALAWSLLVWLADRWLPKVRSGFIPVGGRSQP
ncbi:MAG: sodium:solute symporter family protein [Thermoanaerobaculum sp.]|nr:sodium:solute symporter family protein [Thermoanaerobaculum sp.]MDW7968561.1 sodium:solute symporter family protein [Thermoanaerobaculum sp.]